MEEDINILTNKVLGIEDRLIIELKSVENLQPIHSAQILTYLKLSHIKYGLLLNFNVSHLKYGIKRFAL